MMNLTYIFHSGFVLETERCILVFDYWMDPAGVMQGVLASAKPMYVFSSHFHEDHFTREIFARQEEKDKKEEDRMSICLAHEAFLSGEANSVLVY